MSVHALFRMARSLFPIQPQSSPEPPAPTQALPSPTPPQRFRPTHSLYSSITSRHEQLQRARDGGGFRRGGSLSEKDSSPGPSQKAQGCAP